MERRAFIYGATVALCGLAGCSSTTESSSNDPETSTPPPAVSLEAADVSMENPDVTLDIDYNWRVQNSIPTDPTTVADEGHKWLVVRMDVTNTGDQERDLTAHQYVVNSGDEMFEYSVTKENWALEGKSAGAGETVTGWVVYQLPDDVQEGVLTVRENTRKAFSVTFTHDSSMPTKIDA